MTKYKKGETALFLLYAFIIPLICVGLMKIFSQDEYATITFILYGIEGASPALAAIIVTAQFHGMHGLKMFLKNKYIKCFRIRYCLIGFGTPILVLTISKLITYLTPYYNDLLHPLSSKKLIIILWALIAEELGWRGFLQERIESQYSEALTPLIIGVIWSLWHYHFFISGSMEVPIVLFVYGCITESYGYFVITKLARGNIIPASLWHFTGNLFFNIYRLNPNWNNGSNVPYLIVSAVYTIYLLVFIWYMQWKKHSN